MRVCISIIIAAFIIGGCIVWSSANYSQSVPTWTDGVNTILAFAVFVLAYFAFKGQQAMEYFTGAMEHHSHQQRMLAAHEAKVDMYWWDYSISNRPFSGGHNERIVLDRIYIGMPLHKRARRPTWFQKNILGQRTVKPKS